MVEVIKDKIWSLLKDKDISLAMIYDKEGKILWHKGRNVVGKDVFEGAGFCKTYINESLENPGRIDLDDCIESDAEKLSKSAEELRVKSIIIHPIKRKFFLYIDSGKINSFTPEDRISFRILGEILEQVIEHIQEEADASTLTGRSEVLENIRDRLVKYSVEEEPVLLSGETGVGKSHIAELIHRYSGRKGKFVVAEIPGINQTLFESTMFGHKRGSFTDAREDKIGLVQEADKGTLFIDEISEIPYSFQAKLLRFIDKRKYRVLGEAKERDAEVRIVAASNKDLQKAIENKEFREDLYYRLHVLGIEIPPLRDRKEDIKNLVMENQKLLKGKEIGAGFWDEVNKYHWPGNVRELLNVLMRAGILLEGPITGEKIASVIKGEAKKSPLTKKDKEDEHLKKIREELKTGKTFWQLLWRPFIARDLDRNTVKNILKWFYKESSSFKKMSKILNVDESDYKKFMTSLYKYKIHPRDKGKEKEISL
jgi:transcriptional regulator with PAS, ATPase and Fis domain